MNILIATGLYPPEIGGPATYATMLERELPGRGIKVTVEAFGAVRRYPKLLRHLLFAWRVYRASADVDVIYALDGVSVGLPALIAARLRRKPLWVRLGGDYAWEQGVQRFGLTATLDVYTAAPEAAPRLVRLLARLQAMVVSRAAQVVVPSEYLGRIVATWGVPEARIAVIYSALYPLEVRAGRDALREQLAYAEPTLISAGRLVPWKGFMALLSVVEALSSDYPDLTLVIIGDGPERVRLEAAIRTRGLERSVRLLGQRTKEALGAAIKAADVFVLNTAYEGLSHQLLEVMDLGVPIVTTAVGGNPELLADGREGLLVPYDDVPALVSAIGRLLQNPETRIRFTQAARLRSQAFSKDQVVDELATLLTAVV